MHQGVLAKPLREMRNRRRAGRPGPAGAARSIDAFDGLREPVPSSSPLSYPRRSALRPLARRVAVRRSPALVPGPFSDRKPSSGEVGCCSPPFPFPPLGSHHPVARRALLRRRQRFVRIPAHRLPQPASVEVPPSMVRAIESRTRCGRLARYQTSPHTARAAPASFSPCSGSNRVRAPPRSRWSSVC